MYFPRGYNDQLAIELGNLIVHAYNQFDSYEDKVPWDFPEDYELICELTYKWKDINAIDKNSKFDNYLKKISFFGSKNEIEIPIGFIARKKKNIYIIFRGTQTVKEWISNLNTKLNKYFIQGYGNVHDGFLDVYADIRIKLIEELKKVERSKKIFMAGHSLGAAFATLALPDIEISLSRKITALYTFGSPRIGDSTFVQAFNSSFANKSFRIVNSSDMVAEMPFPAPIAGIVGGYFSHVDTPVISTEQLNDIEDNHNMKTYLSSLKKNKRSNICHWLKQRIIV
jgi:triacylglycerol lipase